METHLVLLGAPGSGKGTLAKQIKNDLGFVHLSTGDILRSEIKKESELGIRVKKVLDSGQLVDDSLMQELLTSNVNKNESKYIFDGYPRTHEQGKFLTEELMNGAKMIALHLDLDEQVLVDRLVNRRICSACGEIYNLVTKPTKEEGICDKCGGEVAQRKDDQEDVIRERLKVYNKEISSVIDYYKELKLLKVIDANTDMNEIFVKVREMLSK